MNAIDQGEPWTGAQLAAQLVAATDAVPAPNLFVLFRATLQADGSGATGYELPDPPYALPEHDWPQWLHDRGLIGDSQLRLAVLVIRETLDPAGRIVDCALERRRGAADGPLFGHPTRVEFIGPARMLRFYRLDRTGQLQEFAPSPRLLPPRSASVELTASERQALQRRFGSGFRVIDTREPSLFEDMAGLSSIAHLLLPGAQEVACGIGWHGTLPYTLVADFPRLPMPPQLSPLDEAAVRQALREHRLIGYECRLDEQGLAVMACQPGSSELFRLRCENGQAVVERYQPGSMERPSEDQRRWLRFVQEYEQLVELDHYRDGSSDNLVALSGDPLGHVQQHLVDPDGVELWRRTADDTAVAALYREALSPGGAAASQPPFLPEAIGETPMLPARSAPDDSVLAAALLVNEAIAGVEAAREAADSGDSLDAVAAHLHTVQHACEALAAEHTASRLASLLVDMENDAPDSRQLQAELIRLQSGLHDELALLRLLPLQPAQWRRLTQSAPFGAEVEARFPSSAYDLQEAAACLALRRPTGAMFHSMRVARRGIAAFARHAGVAEPSGNWEAILRQLAACPAALADALSALRRLRRHWHAPGLAPADKCTEAEAEQAFRALGGFLRALAAHCDEDGRAGE